MRTGRRHRGISWGAQTRLLALLLVLVTALAATPLTRVAHAQTSEGTPTPAAPGAPVPAEAAPAAPAPAAPAPAEAAAAAPAPASESEQAELAAPSPPPTAGAPAAEPASESTAAAPAAAPDGSRQALLQAVVDKAERDRSSVVLPWIAAGVGVTTLLVGTAIGVVTVASCDGSCSTGAAWPWVVIAGCTLTSAGSAWLIIALHDQSEAEHRIERAREELERDRIDHEPRAARGPTLTLRASF